MDKQLEDKLRNLKIDLLRFLQILAISDAVALDINEISSSTSTSESNLRGVTGTLRRLDFNGESIIIPAGRDDKGRLRWRINETVVSKNVLAKFLEDEILGKEGIKLKSN
jgi:hypothetical protein